MRGDELNAKIAAQTTLLNEQLAALRAVVADQEIQIEAAGKAYLALMALMAPNYLAITRSVARGG